MGVRLLRGRAITAADRADAPPVAVINETMARQYWPGEPALGRRFRFNGPTAPWIEVVGVVADEKHAGLGVPVNRKWYRPHAQWSQSGASPIRAMTLVVRSNADPVGLVRPVRDALRALDPRLAVSEVRTLDEVVGASVARQRFTMLLLSVFAAIALALAAVGVYGVMSYWVSERTREIGIRMALGATQEQVTTLVVREGLAPVLAGVAGGGLAALGLAGVMRGLLYGVAPRDPVTFVGVALALVAVAVAASWVPARRAAQLPPVEALRHE
jgi:putative ABC transport system permease protein